jgi:hypothetical protein
MTTPINESQLAPPTAEYLQFLSDVMTAAGLVTHGKQSKALGERLGAAVMKFRAAAQPEPAEAGAKVVEWVLLRRDDDGLEPVMFYGGAEKPSGEFKDRFVLRPVCFADQS